jgi:serine/threonine-protein kinase
LRVVAEGGMGIVYEAEQGMGEGSRRVAIKTLLPELSRDHVVVSRFTRECAVVASLEHPNTVRVYDFGTTEDGVLYIAMEYVRGRSLGDVMAEGCMSLSRALHIVEQISLALDEAHQLGIVHRDLKPENVVLTERAGIHDFVKLLDFGIAMRSSSGGQHETKLTQQGMVLGTPPYMSPEQFTSETLDRTSDVYSLGVIVYEMLNGRLPFEADTPWQWAHHHLSTEPSPFSVATPKSVERVVLSALSKQRTARPPTAVEFYRRLVQAAKVSRTEPSMVFEPGQRDGGDSASRSLSVASGATEPSVTPLSVVGSSTFETGGGMLAGAGKTAPDMEALERSGVSPVGTGTAFAAPPLMSTHAGVSTLPVSGSGTEHGAQALVSPPLLPAKPYPARFGAKRRRGKAIVWTMGSTLVLGASAVAAIYWYVVQPTEVVPPAVTSNVEPQAAIVTAEPGDPSSVAYGVSSQSAGLRARSSIGSSASISGGRQPNAGAGGTTAQSTTVSTPTTNGGAAAAQTGAFPFPIPIAIPTGITWPIPLPQSTSTSTTTSTATSTSNTTAGLANCAQAQALAGTNPDAAADQFLLCEAAVGPDAARATRGAIARIGKTRAQVLAKNGQCAEAKAVIASLARINAQVLAQAAVRNTACGSQ